MNKNIVVTELLRIAKLIESASHYSGDPFWLTVKFPTKCSFKGCGAPIKKGERAFYYPKGKILYGEKCGHAQSASADFESHKQDEDFMNNQFGGY